MAAESRKAPSQRQLRVGELLRQVLSELFMRDQIHDADLEGVSLTVTEADVSPDLKNAKVYVMPLGGRWRTEVMEALRRNAGFIRGEMGRALDLKFTPQLDFRLDPTFDEAERIEALLRDPKVARDLKSEDEKDED